MKIQKILFITLSNLGDVILTLPVVDVLRSRYPRAEITVMVGPRPREVFEGSSQIDRLIIYDKRVSWREKFRLFLRLCRMRFDVVIDLRNTLYGALLPAQHRTSPFLILPRQMTHMRDRNLYRLQQALGISLSCPDDGTKVFSYTRQDVTMIDDLLRLHGIRDNDTYMVISAGTGGPTRRWPEERFAELCRRLAPSTRLVFVGAGVHKQIFERIRALSGLKDVVDLSGETNLRQLAYLMKRSSLVITGDTGTVHIASYYDIPVVSLFGPGNDRKYAPWSKQHELIMREIPCRPCQAAQCRFGSVTCMKRITVDEVEERVIRLRTRSTSREKAPVQTSLVPFRRILVIRTDRMGDVVLSIPVIRSIRGHYPNAYLAVMVCPVNVDIVAGNPDIDRVIPYDKRGLHRGMKDTLLFARRLRRERFDCAIVLHPTNRAHSIAFLAGIPRRIGYDRKCGFLLTDRIAHTKQKGQKHELEYNFDLLAPLGIRQIDRTISLPVNARAAAWADARLQDAGIAAGSPLLVIHPGASCPSKIWPAQRFAAVADELANRQGCALVLVGGDEERSAAGEVMRQLHHPALDLTGQTTIAQLAAVLRRAKLLISNDSGPVHVACAVGTPVLALFGRKQAGLSPERWGPVGVHSLILHHDLGCMECLAHNCRRDFACLKAIEVPEVVEAAKRLLG